MRRRSSLQGQFLTWLVISPLYIYYRWYHTQFKNMNGLWALIDKTYMPQSRKHQADELERRSNVFISVYIGRLHNAKSR